MIAGVAMTCYTWLEQGRDVKPSSEALAALGEALGGAPSPETRKAQLAARQPALPGSGPV